MTIPGQKSTTVKENVKSNSNRSPNDSNVHRGRTINDVIVLDSTNVPKDSSTQVSTIVPKVPLTSDAIDPNDSVSLALLSYLETPFDWMDNCECDNLRPGTDQFIRDLLEKTEYKEQGDCQWQMTVVNLVLCYEYWKLGAITKALASIVKCQQMIAQVKDSSDFIIMNREAVQYIVLSSLYFITKDASQRKDIKEVLTPPERHSKHVQAGIYGIRAALAMEYGYAGTNRAVAMLQRAIQMDPDAAEWHFLYGKCLGRKRHVENFHDSLTYAELKSLETAVELSQSKNHFYIIFLAQAYREAAYNLAVDRNPLVLQHINKMNDRALELYEQVLALRPDCPFINVRCAQGYMRFMSSHRNLELAYECGKRAIAASPNNIMINHVWGQINEKMGFIEEALPPLKLAAERGAYGAYMDWFRLRRQQDRTFNPVPELELLLDQFLDSPYQQGTYSQIASYYYFVPGDAQKAVECLLKIVEICPMSDKMRFHKPIGFNWKRHINLYKILLIELPLATDDAVKSNYPKIVAICQEHCPDLLTRTDLVEQMTKIRNIVGGTTKRSATQTTKTKAPVVDLPPSRSDTDRNWRSGPRVGTPPLRTETERNRTGSNTLRAEPVRNRTGSNTLRTEQERNRTGSNTLRAEPERNRTGSNTLRAEPVRNRTSSNTLRTEQERNGSAASSYRTERERVSEGRRMSDRQNDRRASIGNVRNDTSWGFRSVNKEIPNEETFGGPLSWRLRPTVSPPMKEKEKQKEKEKEKEKEKQKENEYEREKQKEKKETNAQTTEINERSGLEVGGGDGHAKSLNKNVLTEKVKGKDKGKVVVDKRRNVTVTVVAGKMGRPKK